jgi:hypothetical protein
MSDADDLYLVEPQQFVAARNELVKRLKASGDKAEAAAVAKLRRPAPQAWALNLVAREQPALVDGALAAGAALREATEAAVGGDAARLRAATADERAATDAVVDAAAAKLGPKGADSRPRLAAMLRAAVLDDTVAGELRRGVLVDVHSKDDAGFGFGFAVEAEPDTEAAARQAREAREARARRIAELEREAERLAEAAAAAEAAAGDARRRADDARDALDAAREEDRG